MTTAALGLFLSLLSSMAAFALPPQIQSTDTMKGSSLSHRWDQAQKATVLVFLSAQCPCSASHEVGLKKLHQDYAGKGFAFFGVHSNSDESREMAQTHFKTAALPFPVLADARQELANAFGALKTPHVFVVNPKGQILFQGGVDDSNNHDEATKHYLRDALSAIEAGKSPKVKSARALGCVIKR